MDRPLRVTATLKFMKMSATKSAEETAMRRTENRAGRYSSLQEAKKRGAQGDGEVRKGQRGERRGQGGRGRGEERGRGRKERGREGRGGEGRGQEDASAGAGAG